MLRLSIGLIVFLVMAVIAWFPGGVIIMGASCHDRDIDGWDWIFSTIVPFYGILEALIC